LEGIRETSVAPSFDGEADSGARKALAKKTETRYLQRF
jgi:hypothetical protein